MIKLLVYSIMMGIGLIATFINPLAGAITCLGAYLLNPVVMTGDSVRYQLYGSAAFLASILLHRPRALGPVGREGSLIKALWAYVAIGALSSLWAQVDPQATLDQIFEVAKTVFFASLLVLVIRTERQMSYVLVACLIGVWHAAIFHTIGVRLGYVPGMYARENGVLPDSHPAVLVMFVPTMILLAMKGRPSERLLCWCALPFVLNSIVTTYMRTYFLALVVELALLLMLLPWRLTLRLVPVLIVGVGLFVGRLAPDDYWEWISTIGKPQEEASANSRFVINEMSRRMLIDYPMGVGYRNYPVVSPRYLPPEFLTEGRRSAHNSYYSVACETGILGVASWGYAFAGALWYLRRIRRSAADPRLMTRVEMFAMGLELGFYGWLVGGMTMAEHEVDPAYWFVAFTVVLVRLRHREQSARITDHGDGTLRR